MSAVGTIFHLMYTNWKGERERRSFVPSRLYHGSTEWHPEPQWLVEGFDVRKQAQRTFALSGFGPVGVGELTNYLARQPKTEKIIP